MSMEVLDLQPELPLGLWAIGLTRPKNHQPVNVRLDARRDQPSAAKQKPWSQRGKKYGLPLLRGLRLRLMQSLMKRSSAHR